MKIYNSLWPSPSLIETTHKLKQLRITQIATTTTIQQSTQVAPACGGIKTMESSVGTLFVCTSSNKAFVLLVVVVVFPHWRAYPTTLSLDILVIAWFTHVKYKRGALL